MCILRLHRGCADSETKAHHSVPVENIIAKIKVKYYLFNGLFLKVFVCLLKNTQLPTFFLYNQNNQLRDARSRMSFSLQVKTQMARHLHGWLVTLVKKNGKYF